MKLLQFCLLHLTALLTWARPPKPLPQHFMESEATDLDFCMSESFPYQADEYQIYREFNNVHSQLGCAERCRQYPACQT